MTSFPAPVTPAPDHARNDEYHFVANQKKLPGIVLNSPLDPIATDGSGHALFGSGNPSTGWDTQNAGAFQIGLNAHYRTGDQIAPTLGADNTLNVNGPAGPQVVDPAHNVSSANANRGATSFDYSFSVGADTTIAAFLAAGNQMIIRVDTDSTANVNYVELHAVFDPVHSAGASQVVWETASGLIAINDDGGNTHVTQNSQNWAFYAVTPSGGGVAPAGQYDVEIAMVGANHQAILYEHAVFTLS